jgi:polyadenylate-binding protein
MWAQRNPAHHISVGSIFVNGLDPRIDSKSLFETFSLFGNILSCKVTADPKGSSKGHGYVNYADGHAYAKEAAEKTNGMSICAQTVQVGMLLPNFESSESPPALDRKSQEALCQRHSQQ